MKNLVVGDTGIIGRHLVRYLSETAEQTVVGLSRSANVTHTLSRYHHESADLLDPHSIRQALSAHSDIKRVYYVARSPQANAQLESEVNETMLINSVSAAHAICETLEHVHLMEGMKWYGSHLGPWKTPAREDDPRHMPPNMYYAQEDWLSDAAARGGYNWSALRPHQVCGFSDVYPHNVMGVIAIYGAMCAELGVPLCFPGSPECFNSVSMVTDAELLSRAMVWCADTPSAHDRALNVGNGDYFRWANIWPELANAFGIPAGPVQTLSLSDFMSDKNQLWADMVKRYGLREPDLGNLVSWPYGDFSFRAGWDDMASTTALRQLGFVEHVDTHTMFVSLITRYRNERIIP